jgi:HSP20 family protein
VEISVAGEELTLKGARPAAAEDPGNGRQKPVTWHRRERGSGGFERRLALPVAVDAARVEARLVDGVLTVRCPKAPQCQPHKIEVRAV